MLYTHFMVIFPSKARLQTDKRLPLCLCSGRSSKGRKKPRVSHLRSTISANETCRGAHPCNMKPLVAVPSSHTHVWGSSKCTHTTHGSEVWTWTSQCQLGIHAPWGLHYKKLTYKQGAIPNRYYHVVLIYFYRMLTITRMECFRPNNRECSLMYTFFWTKIGLFNINNMKLHEKEAWMDQALVLMDWVKSSTTLHQKQKWTSLVLDGILGRMFPFCEGQHE